MLNSINFISDLKTTCHRRVLWPRLPIRWLKCRRFDNTISEFCANFHCVCVETATQKLPVKNLTLPFAPAPSITYKTDEFLQPTNINVFVLLIVRVTLWPWSFYLLTLIVFLVQWLACPTHIPIFVILRLSVNELWITEFDHISAITCHVTCYRGQKWSTFLKSLTPTYLFTL